jgi:pimeloyl-ACP methyl ester carboxylesterase
MALDPNEYFIIVPNMLGNGLSSSPSNTPPPYDKARFPHVTVQDNVAVQHRLVTERFGIERLALVTGWSMGAGQTYQWAVSYPEMVPRILPFCGSAKTSEHNIVFLEGVKSALTPTRPGRVDGTMSNLQEGCGRWRGCTPVGVSRRLSTGIGYTRSWVSPPWRTSSLVSGRDSSSTIATRTTSSRCSGPGRTVI